MYFNIAICDEQVKERDGFSKFTMAVKDINKASKFRFLNTENFEDDVYYIEKINKQYLCVHSSNIRDTRDDKSFYVHLRYRDHKRTKWKLEFIE